MSHSIHLTSLYRFFDVHKREIRGCADNEHQKQIEADRGNTDSSTRGGSATHNPFAALQGLLKDKK